MTAPVSREARLARVFISRIAKEVKQWRNVDTMFWVHKAIRLGCWMVWELGEC